MTVLKNNWVVAWLAPQKMPTFAPTFSIILNNSGMKKALISGITGQDGSYLAEFLLQKVTKYTVYSVVLLRSIQDVLNICILTSGCAT